MRKTFALAVTVMALVCQSAVAAPITSYEITYLPEINAPMGINNAGVVLGYNGDASRSVWLWSQQQGSRGVTGIDIGGMGLNDSGAIVGAMPEHVGDQYFDTPRKIAPDGTVTPLSNDNATMPYSGNVAQAINNKGQAAGTLYQGVWAGWQAVRWEADGSVTKLAAFDGHSFAFGINENGAVVGYTLTQTGAAAFIAHGASDATYLNGLSSFQGGVANWTVARAINDAGQVVGDSGYSGEYSTNTGAVIWDASGQIHSLGAENAPGFITSSARDINNAGVVVGDYQTFDERSQGFIWTPDGGLATLDSLLSANVQATTKILSGVAINDQGQIIGMASSFDGTRWVDKAYVLTPVPESSNLAMLSTGLIGLTLLARRRSKR